MTLFQGAEFEPGFEGVMAALSGRGIGENPYLPESRTGWTWIRGWELGVDWARRGGLRFRGGDRGGGAP